MKSTTQASFQIGKNGLSKGVLNSIEQDLKNHKQVRISVLKSASRNKKEIINLAIKIQQNLKTKCSYRILGFTIIIRK